jgi:hypothetical protein
VAASKSPANPFIGMEADDIVNQFYLLQKAGWFFDPSEVDPPGIWDAAINKMYYTFYTILR